MTVRLRIPAGIVIPDHPEGIASIAWKYPSAWENLSFLTSLPTRRSRIWQIVAHGHSPEEIIA